jgi:cation transport ATPase
MTRAAVPETAPPQSSAESHELPAAPPPTQNNLVSLKSEQTVRPRDLLCTALLAATAFLLWSGLWKGFGYPRIFGLVVLLVGAYPILKETFDNVLELRMTMELSMTVALAAALVIGEVVTALVIATFVLVAEALEALTVSRGRNAIGQLIECLPRRVRARRNGELVEIGLDELREGDQVMVLPGGRIPVDGIVCGGDSFVDHRRTHGRAKTSGNGGLRRHRQPIGRPRGSSGASGARYHIRPNHRRGRTGRTWPCADSKDR